MRANRLILGTVAVFACGVAALIAQSAPLSEAQKAAIAKATASFSKEEHAILAAYPDAYKLADIICKPVARTTLKKTYPKVDRIFFGPNEEDVKKLVLVGNTKVTGRGSFRNGAEWKEFAFVCTFDPDKGTATAFTYTVDK